MLIFIYVLCIYRPQFKHIAGPFGTEGTFTKNTPAEVHELLTRLEQWSSADTRPKQSELQRLVDIKHPLKPTQTPIDIKGSFMGDWYVIANIPTVFEIGAADCIEHYDWDKERNCVQVTFTYQPSGATQRSTAYMRGYVKNEPVNTQWSMSPKVGIYLPLGLTYLIPYIAPDASYVLVGVPDRSYLWIMTRARPPATDGGIDSATAADSMVPRLSKEEYERVYAEGVQRAVELGFREDKIVRVKWT